VAPTGEIFVADMYLNEIRMIYTDGVVSTIFGAPSSTPGIHDGSGREATLFGPGAMCFDSDGYLYFADGGGSKQPCVIRRASPSGWLVTLAGEPCSYWTSPPIYDFGANAAFRDPGAACVDLLGNLLVSDGGLIRRVSPTGTVSTMVDLGTGVSSQGIAQDSQGYVYSVDTAANVIRKSWFGGYQVFAGQVGVAGYVDGTIPTALFNHPTGLVADSSGNFYVADSWNCAIRKISPSGVVSTLAMGGALLNCNIGGMAIDANGNLYVSQVGGTCVLKVTSTGIVSILAGSPYDRGYADGPNNAARFDSPAAVATDPLGNVYVMDQGNNAVRVISPYGIVGTLAGRPGLEGNIPGVLPSTLSLNRSFQVGIAYNSVTGDIDIVLGDGVMRIGR